MLKAPKETKGGDNAQRYTTGPIGRKGIEGTDESPEKEMSDVYRGIAPFRLNNRNAPVVKQGSGNLGHIQ